MYFKRNRETDYVRKGRLLERRSVRECILKDLARGMTADREEAGEREMGQPGSAQGDLLRGKLFFTIAIIETFIWGGGFRPQDNAHC